jgi:2-polyprenyl-3-methyl-5-hydroxy-6-metoxy-1,4-benzoquinol methylase
MIRYIENLLRIKTMAINKCRVCGNDFFKEPLLKYKNMPSVAQNLPDLNNLGNDKGADLKIYQCSGCGLVQLDNEPVSYYREVIRASGFSNEMREFRLKQFRDFTTKHSLKGGKIIEIGCGKGEYLSIMQETGGEVYGLEESEESVNECLEKGLKVSKGFVEKDDYKIDNAPFDAFFMLSFLEHIPTPNSTLRAIYSNLKDDGVGIIEVPNFDMILKNKLFSEFMTDHLFYFTKDTLKRTLEFNGFEVIECDSVWHDYIISATVRKRKKLDINEFYKHQEKIRKEIQNYIGQFKKVAIWGAGHQALAIISMIELKDKIEYVIDSADFKVGKYTPATHIKIVSPDTINSDPVEAIIVIAAGYSDEVANIIKQKYDKNIKVAILRDYGLEVIN